MRIVLTAAMGLVVCACDAAEAPRPGEVRVAFDVESMWLEGVTGFTAHVSQAGAPEAAREVTVDFAGLEFFEPFETALVCERGAVTIEVEAIGGSCEARRKLTRVVACPEGDSSDVVLDGADFPAPPKPEGTYALCFCLPDYGDHYCSGKVDFTDFLHDPETEERGPTIIAATSCTSTSTGYTMYSTDVELRCDDLSVTLPLGGTTGLGPAYPPLVEVSANYGGFEPFDTDITKRFRNGAWLLSPEALATVCSVEVAFVYAPDGLPDGRVQERSNPMHVLGYRLSAIIEDGVVRPGAGDTVLQRLTAREMAALTLEPVLEPEPEGPTDAR